MYSILWSHLVLIREEAPYQGGILVTACSAVRGDYGPDPSGGAPAASLRVLVRRHVVALAFQAPPPPTRLLRHFPFSPVSVFRRGVSSPSGLYAARATATGPLPRSIRRPAALIGSALQPLVTDMLTPITSTAPAAIAGGLKGAIGVSRRAVRVVDVLSSAAAFIYRWVCKTCSVLTTIVVRS